MQSAQQPLNHGQCYVFRTGLADHVCSCFETADSRPWYNRSIPGPYSGTFDALLKVNSSVEFPLAHRSSVRSLQITRTEGIRSLWSGLPPTLVMSLPNTVIYFTTYEQLKCFLGYKRTNTNPFIPGFAGGLARICAVIVTSPLELIRTKKMSEPLSYADLMASLRSSVKNQGIFSLWRGLVPTLWRDLPFSIFYWSTYERLRLWISKRFETSPTISAFYSGASAGKTTLDRSTEENHLCRLD